MEYLQMEAVSLAPSKNKSILQVADNEEHLFLIKSGTMTISFGDSRSSVGPASIALLMPGQDIHCKMLTVTNCFLSDETPFKNARRSLARKIRRGGYPVYYCRLTSGKIG